jgi:hypothetical protein
MRLAVLIALLGLLGCASGQKGRRVESVHLFGLPTTVNLDGQPGSDGFIIRIFVTQAGSAKGARVSEGAIETLMFDGVIGEEEILTKPPAQSWKFPASELAQFSERTQLGEAYRLALRWNQPPQRGHLTVVARYVPEKGAPIYSAPSTITASAR